MKRLFLFVFLAYSCSILAQKNADKDFYNYLLTIMHQNYDERRANVQKAFESKENLKQYQAACSKKYLKLIPDFYQQLDSSVPEVYSKASIQCDGYRVERIILNKRISANLYLPDSKGKKAAALFLCGHEKTGKATESYQQTAILLAKNNFIVLVPDPTGQGERLQLIDWKGKPLVPRATSEHTLLNQTAKLVGWSIPEEELKDNFSLMNYLCSLSAVDTSAIACIGNSGGGTQATFLSALDKRIEAVVCCSWFTQRERMYGLHGPDDGCQYFCGEGKLEIADYYIMRAPKPVLILAGKQDFINYQGSLEAFEELKSAYKLLNCPEKADFFSVDDGHGISLEKREKTVAFLKHCLLNDNSPIISEKDINSLPLTPEMLNCTQNGQMLLDYPQLSFLQEISLRNP